MMKSEEKGKSVLIIEVRNTRIVRTVEIKPYILKDGT